MAWIITRSVLLALLFVACQNEQADWGNEDKDMLIVKTYFLPDSDRKTVESSFKICNIQNNNKALNILEVIYKAKHDTSLFGAIDTIGTRFERKIDEADERHQFFLEKSNEWVNKINVGEMDSKQLAYEYALFQHWIYLKCPDSIPDDEIKSFYKEIKLGKIPKCLVERAKSDLQALQKKSKEIPNARKTQHEDKNDNNDWSTIVLWGVIASIFVVLILRFRNKIKYIFYNKDRATQASSLPISKDEKRFVYKYWLGSDSSQSAQDVPSESTAEPFKKTAESPHLQKTSPKSNNVGLVPIPPPLEQARNQPINSTDILYARMPSGNLFFEFFSSPAYPDTPFIIDKANGTFELVKDRDTLERLFSMIDQLKDACELLNINQPNPDTYETLAKGEVVQEGDFWRITRKLKLDWK